MSCGGAEEGAEVSECEGETGVVPGVCDGAYSAEDYGSDFV